MKAAWRLVRAVLHVLRGMWIIRTQFGRLDDGQRMQRIQWWSATLLSVMGCEMRVEGRALAGAKLLIANHVSWLDILAINAVAPARFVSKSEVRHWPLVGWLVSAAGTLFIERARPRDAMRVVHQMADALRAGSSLAIFPEGTTSLGDSLLPFHANLLQAAITAAAPLQPVVLRYADATHAVSPAAAYIGDTSLVQSLWWIARADGLRVTVRLLPAVVPATDRRVASEALRTKMQAALNEMP